MAIRLSLTVTRAGEEIGVETYDRDIIKIGRLASAHLKLEDPKVSRIHAVIEVGSSARDVSIIDMGSAEGTFVNGDKITKAKLNEGDEIRLGDTRLVLGFKTEPELAVAAASETAQAAPFQESALAAAAAQEPAALAVDVASPPAQVVPVPGLVDIADAVTQPPALAASSPMTTIASDGPVEFALAPAVAATLLSPGVQGNALVPPMPSAPPPDWYDPYGEFASIVIEPEESVNKGNHCLELAVYWEDRLLDVRHYTEPKAVTLGETKKCDVFVVSEGLPDTEFPLVRFMDGEYVLTYFDALDGTLVKDGQTVPFASLRGQADENYPHSFQFPLPLESVTTLDYGGLTLQLRFVQRPGLALVGWLQDLNYNWLNVFLISLFLHVGFFATTALYPYDTTSLEEDLFSSPNRFAQFIINPPEKKKNSLLAKLMKNKSGQSSAKHAGSDGKAGKQDAKDTGKRAAAKSDKPTNEMVVQSKMNQLFGKDGGGGGIASVFGGSLGGELVGALGGVTGAQVGDSYGFGGLGLRGHGPGGGGSSTSTFGVGSIGTRGRGGGSAGYGSGAGGLGGKRDRAIKVSQGTPVVMGSLDKEIIRRVIRENISQIRYCYERELARTPGLYGKVMVKFIIAATGRVSNAQVIESTMKNATVEGCISNKVRGWRFPKPKGGGIVIVSYPFIFKQSG